MTLLIISSSATDWIALPLRSPVADLLADLGRAFDALGISWYLFGAQAAIVYGVARLTADVDVTVRAPGSPTEEWLAALEGHGFARRFTDPPTSPTIASAWRGFSVKPKYSHHSITLTSLPFMELRNPVAAGLQTRRSMRS